MRVATVLLLCATAWAQAPSKQIDVTPSLQQPWIDSGVDVRPGDTLVITADGSLTLAQNKTCGPDGQTRGFRDLVKAYPVNEAGLGALIGRIGSSDVAVPFVVGKSKVIEVRRAGRLFLSINRTNEAAEGGYHATIAFTARGPETAPAMTYRLPDVTRAMIDSIPRRVTDADGDPGDDTNFVVVGSEKNVIQAFRDAGWVTVDKSTRAAFLDGLMESLNKEAYVQMPMSVLILYGRPQDYGLAHAVPVKVVTERHHLRLWKAPFLVGGEELWVGAATHDVGLARDNRPGKKFTHKIDPDIDLEREFVGHSLEETGAVAKEAYVMPSDPSKEAVTATGESFHSDGRVLAIYLNPAAVPK
jgi:LssY C-terminus